MNDERRLLVVSGPSGVGKDTVVARLVAAHPDIQLSVSATTRPARGYEREGQHYYFLSAEDFLGKVRRGEMAEYAQYAGNYYGTPKSEVDRRIAAGITCVLVIEVNGAAAVKKLYPACTTVFILPPGEEEHERRLRGRGSESGEAVERRMAIARREMQLAGEYDFRLVNDSAEECAERLYGIVRERQGGEG